MFSCRHLRLEPTPMVLAQSTSTALQSEVYLKREDQFPAPFGQCGTASRKVEFVLVDIVNSQASDVVIVDRYGSPYMLHLAKELTALGIVVHCIMLTPYRDEYRWFQSTLQMIGASVYGFQTVDYTNAVIHQLQTSGKVLYVAKACGSDSSAYMGGFALFDELLIDCFNNQVNEASVYVGVNSGVTLAGMLAAKAAYVADGTSLEHRRIANLNIVGVPEFGGLDRIDDIHRHYVNFINVAERAGVAEKFPQHRLVDSDITLSLSPLSPDRIGDSEVAFAQDFFQKTGVLLDPIYGLHTAAAMIRDAANYPDVSRIFVNPIWPQFTYFNYDNLMAEQPAEA